MPDRAPAATLQPWQFFALLALVSAAGAVTVLRITPISDVLLVCLTIGAAALVGLGVYQTLWPLVCSDRLETETSGSRARGALEREKDLVLRSIKELEFDRAMGKVADADYEDIVARLRSRAIRLLKQLDTIGGGYRELIEHELASRLATVAPGPEPGAAKSEPEGQVPQPIGLTEVTCPACGTMSDAGARFCKDCGRKLLALLFVALCFASPGRAQEQMPDLRQMSGIPRVVDNLPGGAISVRLVRGQLSDNVVGHPVELHAGDRVETVKTDANGRAEFAGVVPGTSVKVVAVVDGERLESQEFSAPAGGGVRLLLVARAKGAEGESAAPAPSGGGVAFGGNTRVIIELGEDGLDVFYLLDIVNNGRAPVETPAPIVLDMPGSAGGTSLLDDSSRQALARGNRVTITGPFQPGRTAVNVSYEIPYSGDALTIAQYLPVGLENPTVMMRKAGNVNMASPQLSGRQDGQFQGRSYVVAIGPAIAAGGTLTLDLTGLPHYSRVPWIVTFALSALVFIGGVWFTVRARPRGPDAARARQLKGRREKTFGDLVRLEEQWRAGSVDASRYAARRATLVAQLEQIYSELDAEGGDEGLAA